LARVRLNLSETLGRGADGRGQKHRAIARRFRADIMRPVFDRMVTGHFPAPQILIGFERVDGASPGKGVRVLRYHPNLRESSSSRFSADFRRFPSNGNTYRFVSRAVRLIWNAGQHSRNQMNQNRTTGVARCFFLAFRMAFARLGGFSLLLQGERHLNRNYHRQIGAPRLFGCDRAVSRYEPVHQVVSSPHC